MNIFLIIYVFGAFGAAIAGAELIEKQGKPDDVPAWFVILFCGLFWISIVIGCICHACLEDPEE